MQVALVIASTTATNKHASLRGQKLLVVQPQMADGQSPDGDPLVAVDCVGAGAGERVMITSDGRSAREFLGVDNTPVRWTIIGICDK
jgi:ethanolamine utilization protein EutN